MKTWNIPEIKELDVRLTASGSNASTSEENGYLAGDGFHYSTYNSATHEWNSNINDSGVDDGCVSEIKGLESSSLS